MKKLTLIFLLIIALVTSFAITGCGGEDVSVEEPEMIEDPEEVEEVEENYEGYELSFATGSVGGTWYPLAATMGAMFSEKLGYPTYVEPGGGDANAIGIQQGIYDLGITYSFTVDWAYNGTEGTDFEGNPHTDLRAIAALYPNIQHGIVWADSGIESIEDFVGKRFSPGPRGFGGETIARMILEYYDISYDDLASVEFVGSGDAASLMSDRHIDIMMHASAVPWSTAEELALLGPGIDIVHMDDDLLDHLTALNEGIFPYTIPAGTYRGMEEDRTTAAFAQIIAVNKNVPEEVVYNITKTLIENRADLAAVTTAAAAFTAENAPKGTGVMLHPGAERYYKEIGVLD